MDDRASQSKVPRRLLMSRIPNYPLYATINRKKAVFSKDGMVMEMRQGAESASSSRKKDEDMKTPQEAEEEERAYRIMNHQDYESDGDAVMRNDTVPPEQQAGFEFLKSLEAGEAPVATPDQVTIQEGRRPGRN